MHPPDYVHAGDYDDGDGDGDGKHGKDKRVAKMKMKMKMTMALAMVIIQMPIDDENGSQQDRLTSTEAKPIFQDNPSSTDLQMATNLSLIRLGLGVIRLLK